MKNIVTDEMARMTMPTEKELADAPSYMRNPDASAWCEGYNAALADVRLAAPILAFMSDQLDELLTAASTLSAEENVDNPLDRLMALFRCKQTATTDHVYRDGEIFVFGSNEAGHHGAGAAKDARTLYGAIYGQGYGMQGQSFAIPTKDRMIETLPLPAIQQYVDMFLAQVDRNPQLNYFLTRIGCGLAGYTDEEIAPMFAGAPLNVRMPPGWREGTF